MSVIVQAFVFIRCSGVDVRLYIRRRREEGEYEEEEKKRVRGRESTFEDIEKLKFNLSTTFGRKINWFLNEQVGYQ